MQQSELYRYGFTAAVFLIVIALRFRRVGRARRLRLETLWIIPILYLAITVANFAIKPPVGLVWVWIALALIVGVAVGWQRGKMMRIEVDPETHALNQRTSPAALLFIVALFVVRNGAAALSRDHVLPLDVISITDILLALGLGLFTTQRVEMYLRAKRLLEEARAAKPA